MIGGHFYSHLLSLAISKLNDIKTYVNLGREGIYNCKESLFKNDKQKITILKHNNKYALRRGFHRIDLFLKKW